MSKILSELSEDIPIDSGAGFGCVDGQMSRLSRCKRRATYHREQNDAADEWNTWTELHEDSLGERRGWLQQTADAATHLRKRSPELGLYRISAGMGKQLNRYTS